ncbi:hypothetical protein OHC33_005377 [Knufia fluminis]|uniref:Uncharacterized protein n=1 Tax=Knufia fluminis TaxID=191047 RepID=A0AAN8EE61_9EURO|nr:hypothetical protein OHC33_005377 [Knufia fluminis]
MSFVCETRPRGHASPAETFLHQHVPNYPLSSNCDDGVIVRFQRRTALTLGTEHTRHVYAEVVPKLAMQHKYLLHAVLATTILHDRALAGLSQSTTTESYHVSHAASLFNQKLSSTIADEDRDALWATAVYLCAMAVFNVDISDPENAWPLRPSHPTDLEWLNMQAGLRVIWNVAQINRTGGLFAHVESESKPNCVYPELPKAGITGISQILVDLCDTTQGSTTSNDPYHTAVGYLSWLLPMKGDPANILTFMVFAGGMTKDFRRLLHEKDSRALLILAIWYSKLFHSSWWVSPRARLECDAICRYLTRLDTRHQAFQIVLNVVRMACERRDSQAAAILLEEPRIISGFVKQERRQDLLPDRPTSKQVDMFWM